MTRRFTLLLLCGCLWTCTGCTSVIKRAFQEAVGARSESRVIAGQERADYKKYKGVTIGEPKSDLGALVDPKFARVLRPIVTTELTRVSEEDMKKWEENHKEGEPPPKPVFPGGEPTLTLEPEITFYKERGGLGSILGSDSYAVVLFWLRDGGVDVGKVEVITKSAASRTTEEDMAKATAKGLAKFFYEKREPPPPSKK